MSHREGLARENSVGFNGGEKICLGHSLEYKARTRVACGKTAESILTVYVVDHGTGMRLHPIVKEVLKACDGEGVFGVFYHYLHVVALEDHIEGLRRESAVLSGGR